MQSRTVTGLATLPTSTRVCVATDVKVGFGKKTATRHQAAKSHVEYVVDLPLVFLGISTGMRLTIGDKGVAMKDILEMCDVSPTK